MSIPPAPKGAPAPPLIVNPDIVTDESATTMTGKGGAAGFRRTVSDPAPGPGDRELVGIGVV